MKRIVLLTIIFAGCIAAYMINGNAKVNIENLKVAYIHESANHAELYRDIYNDTFAEIYRSKRTIARLPGVRSFDLNQTNSSMDRDGESLDQNTRLTIQEIYNALANNISVSELYIVPLTLDPDGSDPDTPKTH